MGTEWVKSPSSSDQSEVQGKYLIPLVPPSLKGKRIDRHLMSSQIRYIVCWVSSLSVFTESGVWSFLTPFITRTGHFWCSRDVWVSTDPRSLIRVLLCYLVNFEILRRLYSEEHFNSVNFRRYIWPFNPSFVILFGFLLRIVLLRILPKVRSETRIITPERKLYLGQTFVTLFTYKKVYEFKDVFWCSVCFFVIYNRWTS